MFKCTYVPYNIKLTVQGPLVTYRCIMAKSLPLYLFYLFQINFRCKPTFREAGPRNYREVIVLLFYVYLVAECSKQH